MIAQRIQTGLRIPIELNIALTEKAEEQGISKNALMLQVLWNYIESIEVKEKFQERLDLPIK